MQAKEAEKREERESGGFKRQNWRMGKRERREERNETKRK